MTFSHSLQEILTINSLFPLHKATLSWKLLKRTITFSHANLRSPAPSRETRSYKKAILFLVPDTSMYYLVSHKDY